MSDPTCPRCGSSAWHVEETNGADYPEPLVETRRCDCGNDWTEVLTPYEVGGDG